MTRVRTAARTGGTLVVTLAALASSCSTATDAPRRGPPVGIVVPPPPVAPTAAASAAAAGSERGSASAAPPPAEAAPEEPAGEPTEDMVLIPAGSFWMGCAPGDSQCRADEKPRHRVTLDAYFIDRHEVTIRDHLLCIGAKRCSDEHMFNQGIKRSVQCGWKVRVASCIPRIA